MNKSNYFKTIVLILFVLISFPMIKVDAQAQPIVVPDDYSTIQDAINNANEGNTIFVKEGVYFEHIKIDK